MKSDEKSLFSSKVLSVYFHDGKHEKKQTLVVKELPLTIFLNAREIVTLLCTDDYPEYLALGFLLNEGLISHKHKIKEIKRQHNKIFIESNIVLPEDYAKKRTITSGCGKGSTFYNIQNDFKQKKIQSSLRISPDLVFKLMNDLEHNSFLYQKTHGVHNSALCDLNGIILFHKDIGRHNSIDKIRGHCFYEKINTANKLIVTSGRISSEVIIKIAQMKIPILISRSAPTDLAIAMAKRINIALIANVKENQMKVYSHALRIRYKQ